MTADTDNPAELTATAAAEAIRTGSLSSVQLVEACLARIRERDPEVHAWAFLDEELALAQARALDARRTEGLAAGPLDGVPVGLKDIIDTRDMPTQLGSDLYKGRRPAQDATITALLRGAGAVILGKTVTTEFALSGARETRNPHDLGRTPGGSSSGSAAAVADRQIPLSVGSQTGGSMLRPASYCGVVGFKPTFGTISRRHMWPLARVLDHPGVYARSIDDIALIGDVLMVADPGDFDMRPAPGAGLVEALDADPVAAPPDLAFVKGPMWPEVAPYMDELFESFVARLGESVRPVALEGIFDRALDAHATVMMANAVANLGDDVANHPGQLLPETVRRVKTGYGITAADYIRALEFRDSLGSALDRLFDRYDALITASATGEAPEGIERTGNPVFQKIWTLLGVPTISLPLLTGPNGLPIGVQLVGRKGSDAALMRTARWVLDQAGGGK